MLNMSERKKNYEKSERYDNNVMRKKHLKRRLEEQDEFPSFKRRKQNDKDSRYVVRKTHASNYYHPASIDISISFDCQYQREVRISEPLIMDYQICKKSKSLREVNYFSRNISKHEKYDINSNSKISIPTSKYTKSDKSQSTSINPQMHQMFMKEEKSVVMEKKINLQRELEKCQKLKDKAPDEILFLLCSKKEYLSNLLNETNNIRDRKLIALLLISIAKSCQSNYKHTLTILINRITEHSVFMLCSLQKYLSDFCSVYTDKLHQQSLRGLLEILICYIQIFPTSACETLSALLPLLTTICRTVQRFPDLYNFVFGAIKTLENHKNYFMKKHDMDTIQDTPVSEKTRFLQPPESFRSVSILPTITDIIENRPFLRPNIISGKYPSAEHYLDVQFRLLREDFIRSLREAITIYRRVKKYRKSFIKCKDAQIYTDIYIVKREFIKGRLLYIANFDIRKFSKIKWEYSKRFTQGSLVCLSNDDFNTLYFASVVYRDVDKLKQGLLTLKFEEIHKEMLNFNTTQSFVLIETNAYFEAYRHNLSALQEIEVNKFPLNKYIVHMNTNVKNPHYLKKTTKYDLSSLFCPLDEFDKYKSSQNSNTFIEVLNEKNWPALDEIDLDESQYAALKIALTKELAIIQGPPGTGKTYLGLRIIRILLNNISCWKAPDNPCPILVVCYTNQALDQFLEGVLLFTNNIVRIGGRCQNDKVIPYQLQNKIKTLQLEKEVPDFIFYNLKQKGCEIYLLEEKLSKLQKKLKYVMEDIIDETKLIDYISTNHMSSFLRSEFLHKKNIKDWLEVEALETFQDQNYYVPELNNNASYNTSNRNKAFASSSNHKNNLLYEDDDDNQDDQYIEDIRGIAEENSKVDFEYENSNISKERQKIIAHTLANTIPMDEVESNGIEDIFLLKNVDKWRLYKYWLNKYISDIKNKLHKLQKKICIKYNENSDLKTEENLNVLRRANVIGITTTGAAKYRSMIRHLNPRIIIVEEAAEILESHIITSLTSDTQHLILIGDHQQLKPNPAVYDLAVKYHLDVSLFERMVNNGVSFKMLKEQHRMRPSIASLIMPHIYPNMRNHSSVSKYEDIKGLSKNVFFITHNMIEDKMKDSKSKMNMHEATFIISLCKYLILQGYNSSQITLLTTYSGQMILLKELIKNQYFLENVKVTVVDNYQGEENDIVLVSFVRSNEDGIIGFLNSSNRVCVALSRAKKGLFAIGNFSFLAEQSVLWKNVLKSLEKQKAIGNTLSLVCPNHLSNVTKVSCSSDFNSVPLGGCGLPCTYPLSCGHTCAKSCHIYGSSHEDINCVKACKRSCENGHKCVKKCYEDCGPCLVSVIKTIPRCKHKMKVPCYVPVSEILCPSICGKPLSCNHLCKKNCGKKCTKNCKELVLTKLICGHKYKIECCYISKPRVHLKLCAAKCNTILDCGHICSGTCKTCYQGRLHQACQKTCKKILVCGHECKSTCSKICPPCHAECENQCAHNKCPKDCGYPCSNCLEPCDWFCEHKKCTKLCGELCDREPCDVPCTKNLKCGHRCVGLCNELCPELCAECNPEMKDIYFGTEDKNDARFVQLQDCKHIFEVNGLTQWMHNKNEKEEIQMKACPKCKVIIRKSLRFGNIIKKYLRDIELLKSANFGDAEQNKVEAEKLCYRINNIHFSRFEQLLNNLRTILMSRKIFGQWKFTQFGTIIELIEKYVSVRNSYIKPIHVLSQLKFFAKFSFKLIESFIVEECLNASQQQLLELSWEIERIKHICIFIRILENFHYDDLASEVQELINSSLNYLCKVGPFCSEEKDQVNTILRELEGHVDFTIINKSDDENEQMMIATDLKQEDCFKCPSDPVYYITDDDDDDDRAVEECKCNKCDDVDVKDFALRSDDNKLASPKDGVKHAANF